MLIKTNTDSKKFQAIALLGICLLTVCAFLPTFWNGFQMEWDDHWMVMNPLTKGHMDFEIHLHNLIPWSMGAHKPACIYDNL